jgi:hypothetical protein
LQFRVGQGAPAAGRRPGPPVRGGRPTGWRCRLRPGPARRAGSGARRRPSDCAWAKLPASRPAESNKMNRCIEFSKSMEKNSTGRAGWHLIQSGAQMAISDGNVPSA